jgi:hypothetical protein
MVRDYETPTVPHSWDAYARRWAERLGLANKPLSLVCSPDRYGIPVVLRVIGDAGDIYTSTRRGSDADNATERRRLFLAAVNNGHFQSVELDVAGYYVGEGTIDCSLCSNDPAHEEWQHVIIRELIRVADPPAEPAESLSADDADDAEQAALNRRVIDLLAKD